MRARGGIWIVMACVLLLAACGAGDSPDPAADSATPPVATATAEPGNEQEVGSIVWAQELDPETGEPEDVVTRFTTISPAIIAVLEVNNLVEGTEFSAEWTIDGEPVEGLEMDIIAKEDLEHAWIVFRFTRDADQRYPLGQLDVTITTSAGDVRESSVEIGFP